MLVRRELLSLAAGAAMLPVMSQFAWAQAYPARPVHLVIGYAPGTAPDIVGRLLAQALSLRLGQQVVVDNRPGASSNLAVEVVVHAPPDGYTLLLETSTNASNAAFHNDLSFDFIRDTVPIASVGQGSYVLAVNPSFPAMTLPEFIAYAKANPGKVNYATAGTGSVPHFAGELFKTRVGIEIVHVPYKSNFYPDVIGGQVQATFAAVSSAIEFVKSGKLRALAVTGAKRVDGLPDVPTIGEFLPGYEMAGLFGIGGPKGVPTEVVDRLNGEISAVLSQADFKDRLLSLGTAPMAMASEDYGKLMASEVEKFAEIIRAANLKLE